MQFTQNTLCLQLFRSLVCLGPLWDNVLLLRPVASLWGTTVWDYSHGWVTAAPLPEAWMMSSGIKRTPRTKGSLNSSRMSQQGVDWNIIQGLWELPGKLCTDAPALPLPAEGPAKASDDATGLLINSKFITWSSVCYNNGPWNFKKFLVGLDSVSVCNWSCHFPTSDMELDIEALLCQGPNVLTAAFLTLLLGSLITALGSGDDRRSPKTVSSKSNGQMFDVQESPLTWPLVCPSQPPVYSTTPRKTTR